MTRIEAIDVIINKAHLPPEVVASMKQLLLQPMEHANPSSWAEAIKATLQEHMEERFQQQIKDEKKRLFAEYMTSDLANEHLVEAASFFSSPAFEAYRKVDVRPGKEKAAVAMAKMVKNAMLASNRTMAAVFGLATERMLHGTSLDAAVEAVAKSVKRHKDPDELIVTILAGEDLASHTDTIDSFLTNVTSTYIDDAEHRSRAAACNTDDENFRLQDGG